MAKRFTSTEIWEEDWFLDMPIQYKLFWFFLLSACDHAGVFKVNIKSFCSLNEVKIDKNTAIELFNCGKNRIRIISEKIWLVEDFFFFQYGGTCNLNNKLHLSIQCIYNQHNISLTSIRGVQEVKQTSQAGQGHLLLGVKDKDKDKDKEINTNKGVVNKKIVGREFTSDGRVILSNGEKQELGENQKSLLEIDELDPRKIYKGYIN